MPNRMLPNRRTEPRYYVRSGEPLRWRLDAPGGRRRKGWVDDVSKSGIALLTEGARPEVGQAIQVFSDQAWDGGLYKVTRVQPVDGRLVRIAARLDSGRPSQRRRPSPSKDQSAQRPANATVLQAAA